MDGMIIFERGKNPTVLYILYIYFIDSFFKGIVSQDFGGLQMILMNITWVPDVPLEVYFF